MRDIEFRTWDKKTKKMRTINSIAFHNEHSCFDYDNSNKPKVVSVCNYNIIEQKNYI